MSIWDDAGLGSSRKKLHSSAVRRIHERLAQRGSRPLLDHWRSRGRLVGNLSALEEVAAELARIVGVDVNLFRPDDVLSQCLRVRRDELPSEIARTFPDHHLQDAYEPFAFPVLDLVEKRLRKNRALIDHPSFQPLPKNEDEWLNRILDLTVAEFCEALA